MSKNRRTHSRTQSGTQPQRRRSVAPDTAYGGDILETLERAGAPLTHRELEKGLAVGAREREAFAAALEALEHSGRVVRNRVGSYLVSKRIDVVAGRVEGHRDGFGFLVPDDGSPDVFLPQEEMRQAMHGDRVAVRVGGKDSRGRPVGVLVEVLERSARRIVGRLHSEHGVLYLAPEDKRFAQNILVPPAEAGKARAGQVVTVELVAQPSKRAQPVGRVAEVLGAWDDPGMEIEIALRKFDLPHEFSRKSQAALRAVPETVRESDLKGRRDLRELHFVTIDGETAKDFDDAVCAVREGQGHRLWVAIADVDHYVRHGEALDQDARERSTSVYFPRRVLPMLPEKLSNGICSLNPHVDRLAMVCEIAITPRGTIARYEFYAAVFRSHARLTYDEVWKRLSSGKPPPHLQHLHEVFRVLLTARSRRGAIDFESVETKMEFGPEGQIKRIVAVPRNDAHRLIEECMLAANVCAGDFLAARGHPALYRIHEVPAKEKVKALREFLAELGLALGGGEAPRPRDYADLLEKMKGRPDFTLLQTILLRSLKQAVYSPKNVGHFGLAFDAYVHFTSPIRRYPDLLVHRAIKACLAGARYEGQDWEELGRRASECERRADEASRDVENWLKCRYMQQHVGGVYEGRVTGVTAFGLFVTLDDFFVDGLVHISELGRDYYRFEPARHMLLGERTGKRYRLADRMKIRLVRVDVESRKIDFVPVERA